MAPVEASTMKPMAPPAAKLMKVREVNVDGIGVATVAKPGRVQVSVASCLVFPYFITPGVGATVAICSPWRSRMHEAPGGLVSTVVIIVEPSMIVAQPGRKAAAKSTDGNGISFTVRWSFSADPAKARITFSEYSL